MWLTFVQLRVFQTDAEDLAITQEDLRQLELVLLARPDAGRVITGTGGLRKVRFAPPSWGRGKSGACRVCYAWFREARALYLFMIYSKHDRENLSPADKSYYRRVLESYRRWLRERQGFLP